MRRIFITPLQDESLGLLSKFNRCLKKAMKNNPNKSIKRSKTETGFVFDFDSNPLQENVFYVEKLFSRFKDDFRIIATH